MSMKKQEPTQQQLEVKAKDQVNNRLNEFFCCLEREAKSQHSKSVITDFAVKRLVRRCRKKARYSVPGLEVKAQRKFIETNELVGITEIKAPDQILTDAAFYIQHLLERFMTGYCPSNIQNTLDMRAIYESWGYGPGASNGIEGSAIPIKINSSVTCTSKCEPYIKALRKTNAYFSSDDLRGKLGTTVVRGSKLSTVLKNEEQLRTIAIEPLGNMMMQLAAGHVLEEVCAMAGFRINEQQAVNNLLAKLGSENGLNATLDLSSASDMFSLVLLRRLWPSPWVKLLTDIRSEHIRVPGSGWLKMEMVSTMGNGFTFPFMTLTILALIYGMRAQKKGSPVLFVENKHTAVYGDDIIVPVHEYTELTQLLTEAGLVVNYDKSYCYGYFRESCGGDYYDGGDVTPFYVKDLSTDRGVYVAINQLIDWTAKYGFLFLETYALLLSYLRRQPYFVPEWHGPEQGIRTSQVSRRYKFLEVVPEKVTLDTDDHYMCMLACGGFIESNKPSSSIFDDAIEFRVPWLTPRRRACTTEQVIQYTPRSYDVKVRTRSARLPQGVLDGADPLTRSAVATAHASTYVALMH
jgi:hypothetical protein